MICKQTYSYTTPLPPSLTEIFFPSEETSPSPLTTCVPFSVVSTSTAAKEVNILVGGVFMHLDLVGVERLPGSQLAIKSTFQVLSLQFPLLLMCIVEPGGRDVLFITQNYKKEARFPMSKYFLSAFVFATGMISL